MTSRLLTDTFLKNRYCAYVPKGSKADFGASEKLYTCSFIQHKIIRMQLDHLNFYDKGPFYMCLDTCIESPSYSHTDYTNFGKQSDYLAQIIDCLFLYLTYLICETSED